MATYVRLVGYLRPHLGLLGLSLVFMTLFAVMDGFGILVLIPFLKVLFGSGDATIPPAPDDLFGKVEHFFKYDLFTGLQEPSALETLTNVCLLILVVYLLKSGFNYLQHFLPQIVLERTLRDLRNEVFAHLQDLSFRYYQRTRAGHLLSMVTNDIQLLREALRTGVFRVIQYALEAVVTTLILLLMSWRLTLIALAILPPIMFVVVTIARKLRRVNRERLRKFGDVTSALQENIAGIRIVKAFGAERFERRRFDEDNRGYARQMVRSQKYALMGSPVSEFLLVCAIVLILYIGGRLILVSGTFEPDSFIVFLAAALKLSSPVKYLSKLNEDVQPAMAACERIFGVLDTAPEVVERPDPTPIEGFADRLVYDDVSFAYEAGAGPVLRDVSLTIEKGQIVALVGPSGGGKSTLVDLLPRFYDPQRGRITFDGVDLRDARLADLRAQLGIVTQEVILFHDTIAANVAFGLEPDRERLGEALAAANALEFVAGFPEGVDTTIGERGIRLSGGQRQRIAIARAIYKNPPILIFDEATSALDTESEMLVQQAIARLMENRTAIVIAHRLSTVLHAEQILVLDEGRIVERGTHAELLAREGRYSQLYELQFADLPA